MGRELSSFVLATCNETGSISTLLAVLTPPTDRLLRQNANSFREIEKGRGLHRVPVFARNQ
jgi:hypothetical protein